jgi:hypothetical protein
MRLSDNAIFLVISSTSLLFKQNDLKKQKIRVMSLSVGRNFATGLSSIAIIFKRSDERQDTVLNFRPCRKKCLRSAYYRQGFEQLTNVLTGTEGQRARLQQ